MQREVAAIARDHGIALLGPNCMGMVDRTTNAATYIGDVNPWQPRGGVAGIAQSGSVTDAFIHAGNRIGFSRIIGCGSEVVLDACDFLAYCLDDPETHAVILFLEGFKRLERFLALADRALELDKPVMVVKVGRSPQAQAAAIAHSGSFAGEERATDAALRAAGVIRCDDLDELLETAELVGAPGGWRPAGRAGADRRRTVSTDEASLIRRAADRETCRRSRAGGCSAPADQPRRQPLDPWRDRRDDGLRRGLRRVRRSGAYDLIALVQLPYRRWPRRSRRPRGDAELIQATAGRPELLPVSLADVGADAGDEGPARRGRRHPDAARDRPGVQTIASVALGECAERRLRGASPNGLAGRRPTGRGGPRGQGRAASAAEGERPEARRSRGTTSRCSRPRACL
jgi:hypothetical protein